MGQDWFDKNAPQQQADWFAQNAPDAAPPAPDTRNALQKSFDANTQTSPSDRPLKTLLKSTVGAIGAPFLHPLDTLKGVAAQAPNVVDPTGVLAKITGMPTPADNAGAVAGGAKGDFQAGGLKYAGPKMAGSLIGNTALGAAVGAGVSAAAEPVASLANKAIDPIKAKIPTRAKAGQLFQTVMRDAGDAPVNMTNSSDPLLRVRDLADRGTSMPQAANKLLYRVTSPDSAPLTYAEARDFASNLSRLSADEAQRLSGPMKNAVGQLSKSFNQDVGAAAESAGRGQEYHDAMRQYAQASRNTEMAKTAGKVALKYAIPAGAGYEVARKIMK